MYVDAIATTEWCKWEHTQAIMQVRALCGRGNTQLMWWLLDSGIGYDVCMFNPQPEAALPTYIECLTKWYIMG